MDTLMDKGDFIIAGVGGIFGWFFGGLDSFIYALLAFTVIDYMTGLLAAVIKQELSSEVGFRGIAKKITIFALVGVANVADQQLLGQGAALRTTVIFFYMANEGVFILENAVEIGIPIPDGMKDRLLQIKGKQGKNKGK